eukprot:TRINITY_DN7279_c0_g1_i1.p1 TRINITY_DN7279_c0_g1~~TRINITY_DN7279_c0_g1_i1.p1  ORF type:complete len:234 (-),score=45.66 TRINITY_DN7279_c0_g1_i1:719-1342(-)
MSGRKILFSCVVLPSLGVGGTWYLYQKRLAENKAITPQEFHAPQQTLIDTALTSKESLQGRHLTLYQYHHCPFCNKVKTFLEYSSLPYDVIEVDPLFKREIRQNGFGKVPQLRVGEDGPLLVDSDEIMKYLSPLVLEGYNHNSEDVTKWCKWTSEVLEAVVSTQSTGRHTLARPVGLNLSFVSDPHTVFKPPLWYAILYTLKQSGKV